MNFSHLLKIALHTSSSSGEITAATLEELDRAGAFCGKPALRFIFSTALRNGTFRAFRSLDGLSEETRQIVERFIAHTGFQQRITASLFEAYADCLGWSHAASEPPQPATSVLSGTELINHLNSILTIDREKEPYRGATIEHPAITAADSRGIRLTATLRRTDRMGSASMHYALRSAAGTIIATGQCALLTVTSPSSLPVAADIPCNPHSVRAITLFIQ